MSSIDPADWAAELAERDIRDQQEHDELQAKELRALIHEVVLEVLIAHNLLVQR